MTSIFEDVDLENTRHLDDMLLASVFKALNVEISTDELQKVFQWIDREERGAVTGFFCFCCFVLFCYFLLLFAQFRNRNGHSAKVH